MRRWVVAGAAAGILAALEASGAGARALHYQVTVTVTGPGHVTAPAPDPTSGSIDCPSTCSAFMKQQTTVTFAATPDEGSVFSGWGGDCASAGTSPTCSVSMTGEGANGTKSITAGFNALPPPPPKYTLTVTKAGTGTGYVGGAGGIDCGPVCSVTLQQGAVITLLAVPDQGSIFAGWVGGGCSGKDKCTVTFTADAQVAAVFFDDRQPPHVRTVRTSAAPGTTATLRYRVYDDSGMSREVLTIVKGKATLGRVTVPMEQVRYGRVYSATWRVPRKLKAGLRLYCAVAFDPSGHASKRSCSPFDVT